MEAPSKLWIPRRYRNSEKWDCQGFCSQEMRTHLKKRPYKFVRISSHLDALILKSVIIDYGFRFPGFGEHINATSIDTIAIGLSASRFQVTRTHLKIRLHTFLRVWSELDAFT